MNSLEIKNTRLYVGVYGIYIKDGKVLLIKKARGPYKGMFDLPGGGIESEEKVEDALKREILEETGATVSDYKFIGYNEYFSEYLNEKNEPSKLHHIGLYHRVSLLSFKIKTEPDGEDSLGAEFIDIKNLDKIHIAPIAKPMILKAIKSKG